MVLTLSFQALHVSIQKKICQESNLEHQTDMYHLVQDFHSEHKSSPAIDTEFSP